MISNTTIRNSFEALKLAAQTGYDLAYELSNNDSLIQKNEEIAKTCEGIFNGYSSVDSYDLNDSQKTLLGCRHDYILPGCSTSLRKTIAAAVSYYIERPYHHEQAKKREEEVSLYRVDINTLNDIIARQAEEINQLEIQIIDAAPMI